MKLKKNGKHVKTCRKVYEPVKDVIVNLISLDKKPMNVGDTIIADKVLLMYFYANFIESLKTKAPLEYDFIQERKGKLTELIKVKRRRDGDSYYCFLHDNEFQVRVDRQYCPHIPAREVVIW